jgi:uncharacterized protein YjfI (DUF2170 family)
VGIDLMPWISQHHFLILVSVDLMNWMERVGSAAEVNESEMNMLMLIYGVKELSVGFGGRQAIVRVIPVYKKTQQSQSEVDGLEMGALMNRQILQLGRMGNGLPTQDTASRGHI